MAEIGEVSIKISLDDSGIQKQLNGIKAALKNIEKIKIAPSAKGIVNPVKTLKREITNTKNAAGQLNTKIKETATNIKTLSNGTKVVQKNIRTVVNTEQEHKKVLAEQKQLQKELASEAKRLLKIDQAKANFNNQVQKELDAKQNEAARKNEQLNKQEQQGGGSGLNSILLSSMKILRITTTITAVYAIIKTAVRAWLNTVKSVLNIYKNLLSVIARTTINITKFVYKLSGTQTVINGLKNALSYVGDKVREAFSVDNIKNFISECVEASSKLTEVKNVFDTILTKADSDIMTEWASSISDTFGLNEVSASKFASTFTSMFNSMGGFDSSQITVMSQNMTQATADLASFMNTDYEEAFKALQSGLAGQTKSLMKYGISVHQATLEQYLMSKGIKVSMNNLTQSQKMYVRQAYILEAMQKYQGDFNKTQYTFANQTRLLSENMGTLKASIGELIKGAFSPLIVMLNTAVKLLTELLATPLAALKGMLSEKFEIQFDVNNVGLDEGLDDVLNDVEEARESVKRSLSSYDELHKLDGDNGNSGGVDWQVLLDSLNSAYAEVVEDVQGNKWEKLMTSIWNQLVEAWNSKDFTSLGIKAAQAIKNGLKWVNEHKNDIFDILSGLGKSLATFINGLFEDPELFSEAAKTLSNVIEGMIQTAFSFVFNLDPTKIGNGINAFITGLYDIDENGLTGLDKFANLLSESINKISNIFTTAFKDIDAANFGIKIGNAINRLFENINWSNFGSGISAIATALTKTLSNAIKTIKWDEIGNSIDEFITALLTPDKDGNTFIDYAGDIIIDFVNGLIKAAEKILNGKGFKKLTTEIQEFFKKVREKIDWSGLTDVGVKLVEELDKLIQGALNSINWTALIPIITKWLGMVISGVLNFLVMAIAMIGLTILDLLFNSVLTPLFDAIEGFWETTKELCKLGKDEFIPKLKEWLAEMFGPIGEFLGLIIGSVLETIFDLGISISKMVSGIAEILGGIIDFIVGVFTGDWDRAWEGIKGIVSGIIDFIGGLFKGLFSWFGSMFDWIEKGINKAKEFLGLTDGSGTTSHLSDKGVNHSGSGMSFAPEIRKATSSHYIQDNTPALAIATDTSSGYSNTYSNKYSQSMSLDDDTIKKLAEAMTMNAGMNTSTNSGFATGDLQINLNLDGTRLSKALVTEQQINTARGSR